MKVTYKEWIAYVFCFMFFAGFVALFIHKGFAYMTMDFLWGFVLSLLLIVILTRLKISQKYTIIFQMLMWVNVLGLFYFYETFTYYDKIVHFLDAIAETYVIWNIFAYYLRTRSKILFLVVFLSVSGVLGMWEIYEYLIDVFFNAQAQGVFNSTGQIIKPALADTMQDLMVGMLGSLVFLLGKAINKLNALNKRK